LGPGDEFAGTETETLPGRGAHAGAAEGEREEGGEGAVGEAAGYMKKSRVVRLAVAVVVAALALVLGWVIGVGLVGQ
jgi:hypothetical protein